MSIVFSLLFSLIFSFGVRLEKRNEFGNYSLFFLTTGWVLSFCGGYMIDCFVGRVVSLVKLNWRRRHSDIGILCGFVYYLPDSIVIRILGSFLLFLSFSFFFSAAVCLLRERAEASWVRFFSTLRILVKGLDAWRIGDGARCGE